VRVEAGVTYHGIALNVTTALRDFELIDACGLPGIASTSVAHEAGWPDGPPTTESVRQAADAFAPALARALAGATSAASGTDDRAAVAASAPGRH
jgi:lipoyl(octanoyl) transferase